jgi:hypothetical protein
MASDKKAVTKTFVRYPGSSVFIYNGSTVLHFLLGGFGIMTGYHMSALAVAGGSVYMAFAFLQMYVLMPLMVCPNCVYYRLENSLCVSGMNLFSRKIAKQGELDKFPNRGKGVFCHNNMYMASLIIPILAMLPALVMNFSYTLLAMFLAVLGLMLFRIFILFPKIACNRCCAKKNCPNAQAMGLSD